jgi:hypothetical protein
MMRCGAMVLMTIGQLSRTGCPSSTLGRTWEHSGLRIGSLLAVKKVVAIDGVDGFTTFRIAVVDPANVAYELTEIGRGWLPPAYQNGSISVNYDVHAAAATEDKFDSWLTIHNNAGFTIGGPESAPDLNRLWSQWAPDRGVKIDETMLVHRPVPPSTIARTNTFHSAVANALCVDEETSDGYVVMDNAGNRFSCEDMRDFCADPELLGQQLRARCPRACKRCGRGEVEVGQITLRTGVPATVRLSVAGRGSDNQRWYQDDLEWSFFARDPSPPPQQRRDDAGPTTRHTTATIGSDVPGNATIGSLQLPVQTAVDIPSLAKWAQLPCMQYATYCTAQQKTQASMMSR